MSAQATLFFRYENKHVEVESYDHAQALAVEKGILFFSYKRYGREYVRRFFFRASLLGPWIQTGRGDFEARLEKHWRSA